MASALCLWRHSQGKAAATVLLAGQVLFRYAVAILKYMETVLLSTCCSADLNNAMRYIGDSLHDADRLAQVSFVSPPLFLSQFVC